jgi:hypothetical protein
MGRDAGFQTQAGAMREGIVIQKAMGEGGDPLHFQPFDKQAISRLSLQHDVRALNGDPNTPI